MINRNGGHKMIKETISSCANCFDTGCPCGGIGLACEVCFTSCCTECEVGLKRLYGNDWVEHVTEKTIRNSLPE